MTCRTTATRRGYVTYTDADGNGVGRAGKNTSGLARAETTNVADADKTHAPTTTATDRSVRRTFTIEVPGGGDHAHRAFGRDVSDRSYESASVL